MTVIHRVPVSNRDPLRVAETHAVTFTGNPQNIILGPPLPAAVDIHRIRHTRIARHSHATDIDRLPSSRRQE